MPALGSQFLLAAIFVSVGFVVGALVCLWWFEHQKQTPDIEHKPASKKLAAEGKENLREVMRLLRDRLSGNLLVEIGGKTYTSTKTLSPIQRQELVKLLPEWAAWMRSEGEIATQPLSNATAIEPVETPKIPENLVAARMAPGVVQTPPPVQASPRPGGTGPLPALNLLDPTAVKEVKPLVQKSIVAQINDILQENLPGTPLDGKGIRLSEDLRHGVIVWIGQERFPGIEAVPDPEIQVAIRSAVSQWEALTENRIK